MKRILTILFQVAIILISITVFILLIKMPLTEGRAKDLDLVHIYADPFILFGYLSAIVFYVGLYQVYKILGWLRKNEFNSTKTIHSLQNIQYAAFVFAVLMIMAGIYIRIFHAKEDDPAGFLAICFLTTLFSIGILIIAVKQANKILNTLHRLS